MEMGVLVLVWVMMGSCFWWDGVGGQLLLRDFYDNTCPAAQTIVRNVVKQAVANDSRMAASLLRLHFHDCFVNGCDASILLDDNSTFTGEKSAGPNANSIRGYEVIDRIKSELERKCSGVVSCADIVTIAARDAVVEAGGPSWTVLLGRRDSASANFSAVAPNIPSPFSDLSTLISNFKAKGLSEKEMVVLSGAHTFGLAKCSLFRNRIYNETNIDPAFANIMKARCPSSGGDTTLSPLDFRTPTVFDNVYYKNLQAQRGLFHSDQELFNHGSADSIVNTYAGNQAAFFCDFVAAMIKLGSIQPLTGTAGQIRKNCRKAN